MRALANKSRMEAFCTALGKAVRGSGRIYLVGGATAVLYGWRETTIDIDLKALPEPPGLFEAIHQLKESLDLNIELASPDQFIPELPGWEDRSPFIIRHGQIDFYHYDPYSQVLAKLERSHPRDLQDCAAMLASSMIEPARLRELFLAIKPSLIRYPAIQADVFEASLDNFIKSHAP